MEMVLVVVPVAVFMDLHLMGVQVAVFFNR
jgi:hypothetical protein